MTLDNLSVLDMGNTFRASGYKGVTRKLETASDISAQKAEKSFGDFLMEAVSTMNDQQLEVGRLEEKAMTDPDRVQIHEITEALAKSQMSLSLAKTVVDRVVTGWNEITTTR